MQINQLENMNYGISVKGIDAKTVSTRDINFLKEMVYEKLIVVLKNQSLRPAEYVAFGKQFGKIEPYYEDMYHHPEEKDIFVSSNVKENGQLKGVPKTGSFWHSDYAFMPSPFAISIIYPQIIPDVNRGTYFIDMVKAYDNLSEQLKMEIDETVCEHSVRNYFKIRPSDVYRPIGEIFKEIEARTPPVFHPTVAIHPITKQKILYLSQGFTLSLQDKTGRKLRPELLQTLFECSGQLDQSFKHPLINLFQVEKGDIVMWDNRRLIHHAKHSSITEPSKSFRLTVYDEFPFSLVSPELKEELYV